MSDVTRRFLPLPYDAIEPFRGMDRLVVMELYIRAHAMRWRPFSITVRSLATNCGVTKHRIVCVLQDLEDLGLGNVEAGPGRKPSKITLYAPTPNMAESAQTNPRTQRRTNPRTLHGHNGPASKGTTVDGPDTTPDIPADKLPDTMTDTSTESREEEVRGRGERKTENSKPVLALVPAAAVEEASPVERIWAHWLTLAKGYGKVAGDNATKNIKKWLKAGATVEDVCLWLDFAIKGPSWISRTDPNSAKGPKKPITKINVIMRLHWMEDGIVEARQWDDTGRVEGPETYGAPIRVAPKTTWQRLEDMKKQSPPHDSSGNVGSNVIDAWEF